MVMKPAQLKPSPLVAATVIKPAQLKPLVAATVMKPAQLKPLVAATVMKPAQLKPLVAATAMKPAQLKPSRWNTRQVINMRRNASAAQRLS